VGSAATGQVDSGTRERLGAVESETPADSGRTTAAEIRRTAGETPAGDAPQTTDQVDDATPDGGSQTKTANVENTDSPATDLRGPIPTIDPRAAETAPAATVAASDRESVQPLDTQDQAGAAAELGRLQQQMAEIKQSQAESLAAELRQPEITARDSAAGQHPPLAAELRQPDWNLKGESGQDEPVSGAEVKAAALAGAAGGEARSKLTPDVGQPAGNEAGSSVAAAVRRGRTEDAEEAGTPDQGSAKSSKKQPAANDDAHSDPEEITPAPAAGPTPGETVVSMQPYYRQADDAGGVPPAPADQRPPADQAEIEMDAAVAKAAQRQTKTQDVEKAEPDVTAATAAPVAPAAARADAPPAVTEAFGETPAEAGARQPKSKSKTGQVDLADPPTDDAAANESPPAAKQSSAETLAAERPPKRSGTPVDSLPPREKPQKKEPRPSDARPGKGLKK
jgi:hypothetical protein